ncbi:hypothetical protein [Micromonospora sp. NPDC005367]|uniref:hypothetical protein n=1 Tax=Micromonospora sp. NPDC005367 TaxID=3155590 RepID=UPI0033A62026
MGLFSKKTPEPSDHEYRGGCSTHDMRGPARKTMKEANKDAYKHGERMHGSKTFYGGYVERRK